MLWPTLTSLALGTATTLHFWWRRRFDKARHAAREQIELLQEAQARTTLQIRTQKEVLFNGMIEGLLLLDGEGRIQLANRAFGTLFGLGTDVRGKTIMEALRLHELAELAELAAAQGQVLDRELKIVRPADRCLQI